MRKLCWCLSRPDELAPGRISSGWLLDTAVCHPDDISYHRMLSGWLSRNRYLIRMSYDNVIMPSGWHRLPFLSHPDEIVNFDFTHHAVALQRFRTLALFRVTGQSHYLNNIDFVWIARLGTNFSYLVVQIKITNIYEEYSKYDLHNDGCFVELSMGYEKQIIPPPPGLQPRPWE